ncbi:MAG TPA: geranylgeranylglyceryl/heptaprenylglyceryl phosphate synthase [Gemmatimonadaceae bacterium]|nr:geranylgeranylglyceryl/heptaprenylglyceryl phosphate synthase [Gemmatimonadaceae bacterium]
MTVLERLERESGLVVLVDPARTTGATAEQLARRAADEGVAALLIGNSFGADENTSALAKRIKSAAPKIPLLQFPANASQLVANVDAVLFLSLVSGRNPQYLIEEHVRAIPFFARNPSVEAISTGYVLVDGGCVTSVEAVSQTRPLPANKPELVRAHVAAAIMIGMRATYLDAGSGARCPIAAPLIRAARDATSGPLFVGGGIRDADEVRAAREAGASHVVVGTLFERDGAREVRDLTAAARA